MKALSIHQPYAHLIVTPAGELPRGMEPKRIENRGRNTSHRGPLLIHASKSRVSLWFDDGDESNCIVGSWRPEGKIAVDRMTFGALVGVVIVHATSEFDEKAYDQFAPPPRYAEGPCCWHLRDAVRFLEPIPYRAMPGIFDVPDAIVADALKAVGR